MRKVFLFSAAATLLCLASCGKEPGVKGPEAPDGQPVEVTVSIRGSRSTRAVGTTYADESKVNSLQIFVFNEDKLETHRSVSNVTTALIPATSGERTVWAVVNAPDLYATLNVSDDDPMTLSRLMAHMSNLSDNSAGGFVMTGSVSQELVDGGNVVIDVKRIVSRVSISRISASLKDYRETYSVRIDGLYLINAAANVSYGQTVSATAWANPLRHADAAFDALLFDSLVPAAGEDPIVVRNNEYVRAGSPVEHEAEAYTPESIAAGQYVLADGVTMSRDNSYQKEHVFYPYPNKYGISDGASTNYDDTWSERGTILVIEATMFDGNGDAIEVDSEGHPGQTTGYYPIALPALGRNKTYTIDEVRITRLPGADPYKPIKTGESRVTITVHDWELGIDMGTVNI